MSGKTHDDGFGARNQFLTDTPSHGARRTERALGGFSLSLAAHVIGLLLVMMIVARSPVEPTPQIRSSMPLVFIQMPAGPGGSRGGGGEDSPKPARRAQLVGRDAVALPSVRESIDDRTSDTPPSPPPEQRLLVAEPQVRSGLTDMVGAVLKADAPELGTRGPGDGPGADGGRDSGSGPGAGPGAGKDGAIGGRGLGDGLEPGNGVSWPTLVREVRPNYTAEAMRARVEGLVHLEIVVLADGSVGPIRLVRPLDGRSGLEEEAMRAVRLWRFDPAKQQGRAVAVRVPVEVFFRLR